MKSRPSGAFRGVLLACALTVVAACGSASPDDPLTDQQHQRIAAMADKYGGAIRYGAPYDAREPLVSNVSGSRVSGFDPTAQLNGLIAGEGAETVFYSCSACHSIALVMEQKKSRSQWSKTLDTMIKDHGMPPPQTDARDAMLEYLSRNYGADAAN